MILHVLIAMVAGWIQQHQQRVIAYLIEENRILQEILSFAPRTRKVVETQPRSSA
jgi:hypothetical protein